MSHAQSCECEFKREETQRQSRRCLSAENKIKKKSLEDDEGTRTTQTNSTRAQLKLKLESSVICETFCVSNMCNLEMMKLFQLEWSWNVLFSHSDNLIPCHRRTQDDDWGITEDEHSQNCNFFMRLWSSFVLTSHSYVKLMEECTYILEFPNFSVTVQSRWMYAEWEDGR